MLVTGHSKNNYHSLLLCRDKALSLWWLFDAQTWNRTLWDYGLYKYVNRTVKDIFPLNIQCHDNLLFSTSSRDSVVSLVNCSKVHFPHFSVFIFQNAACLQNYQHLLLNLSYTMWLSCQNSLHGRATKKNSDQLKIHMKAESFF